MLIAILILLVILLILTAYMVVLLNSIYLALCLVIKQTDRRKNPEKMPAVKCNHLSVSDNHATVFYDFNLPSKN